MARHRRPAAAQVPQELLEFDPDRWIPEGEYLEDGLQLWHFARADYVDEHGDQTELGDYVDMLRTRRQVRRSLPPDVRASYGRPGAAFGVRNGVVWGDVEAHKREMEHFHRSYQRGLEWIARRKARRGEVVPLMAAELEEPPC